jgi:hypothetical protein
LTFQTRGIWVWVEKVNDMTLANLQEVYEKAFFVVIQIWLVGAGIKLGSATEK